MKLIDADKLIKDIVNLLQPARPDETEMYKADDIFWSLEKLIKEQPTAFDVDKVIEELEKLADELEEKALTMNKAECFDFANGLLSKAIGVRDAIDIIKVGGIDERNI